MLENLKWKKPKFDGSPGFSSNFEFSKQMQSKKKCDSFVLNLAGYTTSFKKGLKYYSTILSWWK